MVNISTTVKQSLLMLGLTVSIAIAIWFALWVQKPLYKVLVDSEDQIEFQTVIPVLIKSGYEYAVDIEAKVLYVETGYYHSAVSMLREANIITSSSEDKYGSTPNDCGLSYQEFFFESIRMIVGLIIMCIWVFGFLRPMVKKLEQQNK